MFQEVFKKKLQSLREENLFRTLQPSSGVSFIHNDYLGISNHPQLKEAAIESLDIYGAGSRGSRLLGGHSSVFERAEEDIAAFFQAPSALLFSSGYLANLGVVQVLSECAEHVYSDEKNHASLIDGLRLTQRVKSIVPHGKWNEITAPISQSLFIAESLYSMDGDCLGVDAFFSTVQKTEGFALIDEAHAAGVFKQDGRGLIESSDWEHHARVVCFGKAFGVQGAAVLCSLTLRELLINRARTFIYSTAPSPAVVNMIRQSLEIIKDSVERRKELWDRARHVRHTLHAFLPKPQSEWEVRSPIIPIVVPGEEKALRLEQNMRQLGIGARAIRYPTVKKGSERLRLSLNLNVSRENTESMAEVLRAELEK